MRSKMVLVLMGMVCILFALPGWSQEVTGTIVGTVQDTQNKVIPSATVTLTHTDTNVVVRTVKTDDQGEYVATLLPIGRYSVKAVADGFKKTVQTGIVLNVSDKLTINFTLEVGSVAATVTVEASAIQVELQSPTAAGLITGVQMVELPLNNRNYEQLVTLMPGVSSTAPDNLYIGLSNPQGGTNVLGFSINGARTSANNWLLDGGDNVDRGSNLTLLNYPSVDTIAEFKVLRSQYSAEFGRSAAAQVSVISRSGGSRFHGGVYEFFRNDVLAANSFFNNARGITRPPLRYNNFGWNIGGPVFIPRHYNTEKNKSFFFFSQEFRRVITYGTRAPLVPTAAMKSGNFSSPVCVAFSGTTCTATGTSITNTDPTAAAYIKDVWAKIPGPNDPVTRTLFVPLRNVFNGRQELVKIDHVFGPKLSIFGRYIHDSIPTIEPTGLFDQSNLPNVAVTSTNSPGQSVVLRSTATFSPTLLNEAGYSFSYGAIISRPTGLGASANSPDIKPTLPFTPTLNRIPNVTITGLSSIFGFGPYDDFNRNHSVFDNLTKTFGRHTAKVGFIYHHYQKTENAAGNNVGTFAFNTTGQPTGAPNAERAWANFLLGRVANFTQASLDLTPDIRANQFEWYAQDEFRWRPNLTVSYGLRYSFFRQPTDANHKLTNFDPDRYDPAKAPQIDASGNLVPATGDPLNGIIIAGQNSPFGSKVSNENNRNLAPRLGIAWDPFRNGKTSIRAGYGLFYDTSLFGIVEQNIFSNLPFVQNISILNTSFGNPGGGTASVSLSPRSLRGIPLTNHTPYTQQWSLDVQRLLWKGLLIDVGYYGSVGRHLIGIADINQPPVGAYVTAGLAAQVNSGNFQVLNRIRPFRGYGPINAIESQFNSNYNSLQVSVQKKFSGGSLLNIAYTYSKALTNNQTDRSTAPQNTYDIRAEYGPLQQDRTHIFTANYVYEFPWMKSQQGLAGHLLGGWEISGIVTYNSGTPLTVFTTSSADPAGQGVQLAASAASLRPDQIGDPNSNAPHTLTQWFNTAAFVDVPAGQARPGTERRGAVRGPGYGKWDFSLFKNIRVREAASFQFRAEAFNVFNHTNFLGVGTSLGSTTYGTITSTRDPRVMQLALKFKF